MMVPNQACAAIQLKPNFDVDFYYQYLKSKYNNIRDLANSGGQENLSSGIVKSIQIPVPPLPEQKQKAPVLPKCYASGETQFYLGKRYVLKVLIDPEQTTRVK